MNLIHNTKAESSSTTIVRMAPATNVLSVVVPYSPSLASKNRMWKIHSRNGFYTPADVKEWKNMLIWSIKKQSPRFYEAKIWLTIVIERTDMRSDPLNAIDLICDAVKEAIEIDDKWFAISSLDWIFVEKNPNLLLTIEQTVSTNHRFCPKCHSVKPLTDVYWAENQKDKHGFDSVCKFCSARSRKR